MLRNQDESGRRLPAGQVLRHAAVLVDFENIYRSLSDPEADGSDSGLDEHALDDSVELLSNLREHLRRTSQAVMAIGRSYGDFARLGGDAQTQLQLLAFEPRFTMTARKSRSAEVLLSIDAMEMLLTRTELDVFVLVGGDRDYLPVVRRIREHLKRVIVVGFERSTSGDLRQVIGEENFISADSLLPDTDIAGNGQSYGPLGYGDEEDDDDSGDGDDRRQSGRHAVESDEEILDHCMAELLGAYYHYGGRTVWLTPFLRMLNDRFPYLDNRGRKRLVEELQARKAIRIEKVEGDPYPYSVVEINWEDPWVQRLDESRGNA